MKFIKKDKPALIVEENYDTSKIMRLLKKYSYKGYYYSINKKNFTLKRDSNALNIYYLQKKHLINFMAYGLFKSIGMCNNKVGI